MNKFVFKLDRKGVRELLKSNDMEAVCMSHAKKIRDRCGEGYSAEPYKGKNRVNVSVEAETVKAKRDNMENNTILKAVGK